MHKEDLKLAVQNAIEVFQHRKDKKDLLSRLEEQNGQLIDLADALEKKVRERTIKLMEKNEILQMLVEGSDIGPVLRKICKIISGHLSPSPVYIDVPFLGATFSDGSEAFSYELRDMCGEAINITKEVISEAVLCVPLIKSDTIFGTLVIGNTKNLDSDLLIDTKEGFIPTVIICLMQAMNLQQIDKLMDELLPDQP